MSSNRPTDEEQRQDLLRRPVSIRETGLSMALLTELALKVIYSTSEITAAEISRELCLPFAGVVWPVLELLDREELASIVGAGGLGSRRSATP